jgi:hypothetical protein
MEAPVAFGEIGAPKDAGDFAGMVATVRSGGEAAAEEAEPRSRFPGLGPVVEHSLAPPKRPRPPRPFFHAVTGVKKPASSAAGRIPLKTPIDRNLTKLYSPSR